MENPGRVYFAAKNALDKPADIEGRVVDERGRVVALLRSYHDGLGRFELPADEGRAYHVEITRPAGIAQRYAVPAAKRGGCAMQAVDDFASARGELRVALWCTRSMDVAVSAVLREQRLITVTAKVERGAPAVIALPVPPGVQGAVRVTAFDKQLAPLAERLVYRNRGRDLKISIKPDRTAYTPRDRVSLAVETRGPDGRPVAADLAVAVVDDTVLALADDKQATLLARLYLEAELPGQKIEEPNFYFSEDPKAPAAIDLVLGAHGWRRFEWKPVLEVPPPPPIEDPWEFTGIEATRTPKTKAKEKAKLARAENEAPEDVDGADDDRPRDARPRADKAERAAAKRPPAVVAAPPRTPPAVNPKPAPGPVMRAPAKQEIVARDFAQNIPVQAPMPAAAEPMRVMDLAPGVAADEVIEIREDGRRNGRFVVGGEAAQRGRQIRAHRGGGGGGGGSGSRIRSPASRRSGSSRCRATPRATTARAPTSARRCSGRRACAPTRPARQRCRSR